MNAAHPPIHRFAALALALLAGPATLGRGQKAPPAYPERDVLSPFRIPDEIVAPPDAVFAQLRLMMRIADEPSAKKSFDEEGREVVDNDMWRAARIELERLGGADPAVMAMHIRQNRNPEERAIAFYGAFLGHNIGDVVNLISHIPGEPVRRTRELALPRAIAFLKAHLHRTWGDLTAEQRAAVDLPTPGTPQAKAAGITRAPRDGDLLFQPNLKPYFQLLDLAEPRDQAQGLWFLGECFGIRSDLAKTWLELALPRVRELLLSKEAIVREQAIRVLAGIAPEITPPDKNADDGTLMDFADRAIHAAFPPIRKLAEGILLLRPSAERDQIATVGAKALAEPTTGAPARGTTRDGQPYRGYRIDQVPAELAVLEIPVGAVVTAVNGVPINSGPNLAETVASLFLVRNDKGEIVPTSTRTLLVECVVEGHAKIFEYRVF